jgi:uncharacterized protein
MEKKITEHSILYIEKNKTLMEVGFEIKDDFLIIHRTFVDDSLRGQGKAGFLMQEVKAYAMENGLRIKATCSYARHYFEKTKDEIYFDDPSLKESCSL